MDQGLLVSRGIRSRGYAWMAYVAIAVLPAVICVWQFVNPILNSIVPSRAIVRTHVLTT